VRSAGRLLQVVDSLVAGGAEQHTVDLAVGLRQRGWQLAVACSVVGPSGAARRAVLERLADHDVRVSALSEELVKRRVCDQYVARLGDLIDEFSPDVVHGHIYASAAAAARAVAKRPIPLVVTEHTEAPWRDVWARSESAAYYQRADRILCVSTSIRALLRTEYRVSRQKLRLLVPVGWSASELLRAPRKGPNTPVTQVVGFIGRLCPEKGVDVLIRAMPLLLTLCPDVRLVVIGSGPQERGLRQLSRDLGLGGCVTFLGHRDDVPEQLPSLDVLAIPSRSDGAPLVIHEAMQAGVPIVGSAVGGIPDRLGAGKYGILVPPGRTDALAEALAGLLLDPDARVRLSRRARRSAARNTFSGMVDVVERAYAEALAQAAST
jgi:glycosyltransferase involved in cell wall biosynthesis